MVAVRSIGGGLVSAIWATPVPRWMAGSSPAMTNWKWLAMTNWRLAMTDEGLAVTARDRS